MSRLLLAAMVLALCAPAAARADDGGMPGMPGMGHGEGNPAQTAEALAQQALALLSARNASHAVAVETLDAALAAKVKGDVDLRAIRAAHEALHRERVKAARIELEHAFPGNSHLVGVTYRPVRGPAEAAAAAAGGAFALLAAAALVRRRRVDRTTTGRTT